MNRKSVIPVSILVLGLMFPSNGIAENSGELNNLHAPVSNEKTVPSNNSLESPSEQNSNQSNEETLPDPGEKNIPLEVENPKSIDGVLEEEIGRDIVNSTSKSNGGEIIEQEMSPDSLIGDNDRRARTSDTTVHPYRVITYVYSEWPDGTASRGTGFIISEDTVATAGHVIYSHDHGGWADRVRVSPGADGADNFPFGTYEDDLLYSVVGWTDNESRSYDYGAIKIDGTFTSTLGHFGYGVANDNIQDEFARITGYPADPIVDNDKPLYTQWYHSSDVDLTERFAFYAADTSGGQSGSPVYLPGENIARAIHTGGQDLRDGHNRGTRITSGVYSNLDNWANE